jgi:hypothetical protein
LQVKPSARHFFVAASLLGPDAQPARLVVCPVVM